MSGIKINDMVTCLHIIYLFHINAIVEIGRNNYRKRLSPHFIYKAPNHKKEFEVQERYYIH